MGASIMTETALRDAFGKELVRLGHVYSNLVVLDADLATSTKASGFQEVFPERFFEVGNTEQNMMSMAAGMAAMGLIPFTSTFACFTAKRALDQIRITIAQTGLNVKISAGYPGIFTGKSGKTHHSVQDIAIMRTMPHMAVVVPGDATEVEAVMRAAMEYEGPVYIRIARDSSPSIVGEGYRFKWGQPVTLRRGSDVTILSTGIMTARALEAAAILEGRGIACRVEHVPCIKPLNPEAIAQIASESKFIVTAEDHSILGGLGGTVAEILTERCPRMMRRVGLQDTYSESGTNDALAHKYGLTPDSIVGACEQLVSPQGNIVPREEVR